MSNKQKDYLILNDYLTKFPNNHPYNKPSLKKVNFILSNNKVIGHSKLILPIMNTSIAITGQLPSIIKAKKSVASFRLRKNNPVGITTTLRGLHAHRFIQLLKFYILPRLKQNNRHTINIYKFNIKLNSPCPKGVVPFNKLGSLTIGFDSIGILKNIMPIHQAILKDNNLIESTGGYIQLHTNFKYPIRGKCLNTNSLYQTKLEDIELNKFINYYYLSVLNIPIKSNC